jgi:hypothetical protein
MATGITGLFSAGDLASAENQSMRDRAMAVAKLGKGEAGAYAAGLGSGMLIEGLAGMAGMKTRNQKKQEDVQNILSRYSTADQNDPKVLFSLSQDFIQAGYPQLSQSFAERARTLSDTLEDNRVNQQVADANARFTKKPTIEVGNPNNSSQTIRMQLNPDTNQYEVIRDADGNPYVTDKFSTGEDVNLSTDFMAVKDEDGNIIGATEIPGSPADKAAKELERITALKEQLTIGQANNVLELVDSAFDIYNDRMTEVGKGVVKSTRDAIFSVEAKALSATGYPGTKRKNMENAILAITANIGFDKLQAMREASPTGGALGQVAIQELVALQASLGSLSLDQQPEVFYANLEKIQDHYKNMLILMNAKGTEEIKDLKLSSTYEVTKDPVSGEPIVTLVEKKQESAF